MRRLFLLSAACGLAIWAGDYQGVASNKQIMAAIQKPAMDSNAAMLKAGGPKDDKEWETAAQNAAVLAESAQLLLVGGRPKDQDVWVKSSTKLVEAAQASLKAAQAKDLDAWKASLGQMGANCKSCHSVHKKKQQ
jgi:cytochrome c556